jgi:DNA-binding MarR family transcriptional regulator
VARKRAELVQAILGGFQRVSGQSVLLSQVVADKAGLAPSDVECIGSLEDGGPMTAGRLAEVTGLTTGAVTRMIDRLEAAKYVRRRADPQDRRKVIVELIPARARELAPYYAPMARQTVEFLARYSEAELALIADLLERMLVIGVKQTERIRSMPVPRSRKRS